MAEIVPVAELEGPDPLDFRLTDAERMSLEEQVLNSAETDRLLHSPFLKLGFDAYRLDLLAAIETSESNDDPKCKAACDQIRAVAKVRRKLTNYANRGTSASKRLAEDEEQ
jgi:hypothetical protein